MAFGSRMPHSISARCGSFTYGPSQTTRHPKPSGGTTVQVVPSDDVPSFWEYSLPELNTLGGRERFMKSTVFDIDINRDDNWKKGLERVDQMYRYYLETSDERGSRPPPWLVDGEDPADAERYDSDDSDLSLDEDEDFNGYEVDGMYMEGVM